MPLVRHSSRVGAVCTESTTLRAAGFLGKYSGSAISAVALSYRGEACQHLELDFVGLEVNGHFRIRKVQPEVWCSRK
jgi:hypothetical protein